MTNLVKTTVEKFWDNVQKADGDACWLWTGPLSKPWRYGMFSYAPRKNMSAHRWIYMHLHGPLPSRIKVCHTCDNPQCVRPDHLFEGTHSDNMKDCAAKGRMNYQIDPTIIQGENNGQARLTADDVRAIRASNESMAALAIRYGVGHTTIRHIIQRDTWKHIKDFPKW